MSPGLSEACVDEWRKAGGKAILRRKKRMRGCFSGSVTRSAPKPAIPQVVDKVGVPDGI
jgi:hypothetical protein